MLYRMKYENFERICVCGQHQQLKFKIAIVYLKLQDMYAKDMDVRRSHYYY